MADNDLFFKTIPPEFRRAYRCAVGDASPLETSKQLPKGLADLLHGQGCPSFDEFCALCFPCCQRNQQSSLFKANYYEIEARSEEIVQLYAGSEKDYFAQIAARVCQGIALEAQTSGQIEGDVRQVFAQRFCESLASAILDRFPESKKLRERFMIGVDSLAEAQGNLFDWNDELKRYLPDAVVPIAIQLAADPSGKALRAPTVPIPKRSTAESVLKRIA